jgi:hypothetical protein
VGGHSSHAAVVVAYRTSKPEASQAPFLAELSALGCAKDEAVPNGRSSFTVAIALSHGAELMGGCQRAVGAEDPQGSQDSVDAFEVSSCTPGISRFTRNGSGGILLGGGDAYFAASGHCVLGSTPVVRLR